ncbi:MAG: VOC family protein [Maricaulis sp.]|uniref:VOC family protein n=1 Tax=Maricaulis sp. TaxID=1486257 RepID=UPI001B199994|nr:VOC family protein [Maricaulis sp.]MBO6729169.1 VOC family protein [Maricaulis sp.]MBO6846301.1 VOC family protein [Maricaulis sp.]MBO6875822.1 VOC family protein [Maricaulis sp.]
MRLNQITIPVSDIPRSKSFYMRLGFRLLVDSPHYTRFLAPDGDTTFSLHLSEDDVVPGAVIYLESDKVDKEVARLQGRGFEFEAQPEDTGWLWREAVLRDPDGHKIKIYHAGKNRVDPPWRVKD